MPGRLITPGLVDGHCHFGFLGRSLLTLDLSNQPSLASCRDRIRYYASNYQPDEWIIGTGWNQYQWDDPKEPTLEDLDDITSHNPAFMVRTCGHTVWVNSIALAKAGITSQTLDPPGGRIERDPVTGNPNGLLKEARQLIERVIPSPTQEEWKKAILASQEASLRRGLTAVHSMETLSQWNALRALEEEKKLKIRVHQSIQGYDLKKAVQAGLRPGFGSDRLWIGHAKLYADGSLGAGTALLHEPYRDEPSNSGLAVLSLEGLRESVELAYEHGFDVAIHAIGDKAVSQSLEAINQARKKFPGTWRDRLEHVQLLRTEDIELFKNLGVVASVQPIFLPTDWKVAEKRWGPDRCRSGGYVWKTIRASGIRMQFGSDSPVEPNNPLLGLCAAVTRQNLHGKPEGGWYPDQRLDLFESICGFTQTAAWSARKEGKLGSLTPGKIADLTVFEKDLFKIPAIEWPNVQVEMTIINGEIVYQR
jgi:predicted amidohydrolase YtcJ